jgi:glycosyltransferase involved in cell wall biosynthesis
VRAAYQEAESGEIQAKPRILFVLHQASGGTPHTNLDLMNALSDRYSPYVLVSDTRNLKLYRHEAGEQPVPVEEWRLNRACHVTEFHRSDYRAAAFEALTGYGFELVHIRHLIGHTFDLPEVATCLNVPVILSFHDFYFSCPTVHLIDDHGKHCGGICTPGHGRCTIPTPRLEQQLPALKHLWIKTWRQQVERMFEHVDVFVTTSRTSKDVYLRSLPGLSERPFRIIEHGRDLPQNHLATPPGDGPIRILIPGNVSTHKGAGFIRDLKKIDSENRLELHFLGRVPDKFQELGISHGTYEREEFDDRVREIRPSFMGIFSIWPETYCHTLTEAWATGVPVLASDIGTLKERITAHGGGWLVDHENPGRAYEQILEIAGKQDEYARELKRANLEGVRSTREMAGDYAELYRMVLSRRRQFKASE